MSLGAAAFHFAQPWWLLGLLVPPLVLAWLRRTASRTDYSRLQRYADPDLLPHLLRKANAGSRGTRSVPVLWSGIWLLGIIAMAGPRWDFTVRQLYRPGADLVILLDISRSMDTTDVVPSRLARARQEIGDLLGLAPGVRIGLIVFASVAHVVVPVTEDAEAVRRVLPVLNSDLVRLKGSRVSAAFDRAERLLSGQSPQAAHAVLLISDGDFDETGLREQARRLGEKGIRLYALGVGSPEGGPVPGKDGIDVVDRAGRPQTTRLNEDTLAALAAAGGGLYRRATYRDDDVQEILVSLRDVASLQEAQGRDFRIWHERFYLPLAVALLLLIPWFRATRPVLEGTSASVVERRSSVPGARRPASSLFRRLRRERV